MGLCNDRGSTERTTNGVETCGNQKSFSLIQGFQRSICRKRKNPQYFINIGNPKLLLIVKQAYDILMSVAGMRSCQAISEALWNKLYKEAESGLAGLLILTIPVHAIAMLAYAEKPCGQYFNCCILLDGCVAGSMSTCFRGPPALLSKIT